ncbi:MAG: SDR family oxidoreductase [Oscillospiraceae bacterium]|nr:SDR family oxidoreductase [Oscillospiraceae bacterium]
MNKLLDGRAGIITGAASGIGRAAAILFAQEGAKVIVSDVNDEMGNETVELVRKEGGEAYYFHCDVANEENVKELVDFAIEKFGKLDWAYNNAGVIPFENALIHETHTDLFRKVLDINIMGVYYCMKYEIPHMLEAGGSIVNCCSINSVRVTRGTSSYGTSKYGEYGLTQCAALDYGKLNIRINAVGPGPTMTPMLEASASAHPEVITALKATIPDGRVAEAVELANAALFLLSDLGNHINGQLVLVDGGQSCNM